MNSCSFQNLDFKETKEAIGWAKDKDFLLAIAKFMNAISHLFEVLSQNLDWFYDSMLSHIDWF
jgi:hypothetical protein